MAKKKIKRGRDVTKLLDRNGCRWRQAKGSHMVGYLPDGNVITYYDGKLSTGVRSKLVKALKAAGLIAFFLLAIAAGALAALLANGVL